MSIYITRGAKQTQKIAKTLAENFLKGKEKRRILALEGDLGGGKTTFLQGFADGLGIKEKILSPTFVIMRKFKVSRPPLQPFSYFYHVDCYRLKDEKEILDLGFKKIIKDSQNIVAIEWADVIKRILPKDALWIHFKVQNSKNRKITILK